MIKPLYLLPLLLITINSSHGETPATETAKADSSTLYEFTSVEVFKLYKKQPTKILQADRKGVYLDTNKGLKRQKYGSQGLKFSTVAAQSADFIKATGFDFELVNFAAERREATVANALESGANEAQTRSDQINSAPEGERNGLLQPGETVESVTSDASAAVSQADNFRISTSAFSSSTQVADNLFLEFTLTPNRDLEDVVAAIIFRHDILDKSRQPTGAKKNVLSLEKVGDLKAGTENQVEFSLSFREQFLSGMKLQVYLLDNQMNPIASNLAGQVRATSKAPQ